MTAAQTDSQPQKNVGPGDQVILVDGSSFIFRAFFQSMNTKDGDKYNYRPSDGLPTGAVRLFCTKIAQFVQEGAAGICPTHLGIVFDKSEGSFRKELYPEYKGHRPDAPDDLKRQMPLMRDAVRAFGLHAIEMERYEADDLIATYTRQAEARGAGVIIVSSDKDLMQLVGPLVRFYDFESGSKGKPGYRPERNLDVDAIIAKWEGLQPGQIGDALALIGDTSDNVPGVPGIGLKTAAALIKEFGSLEALLERAAEIKQPKRRETLLASIDQARLSRRLVALVEDVAVPVPLDDLRLPKPDPQKLVGFLKAMEFNTLTRRIAQMLHVDPEAVKPDPALLPGAKAHAYGNAEGGSDAVPFFGDSVPPDPEAEAGTPPEVDPFADLDLPEAAAKTAREIGR
ncbi:5'-3' exonuclease H3TH domain-containing protein, partial [Methylobacterium trifolii]